MRPVVSFIGLSFELPKAIPSGSATAVVPGHRGPGRARTQVNAGTHAVAACAVPFRAGRDGPRPAGGRQLTDRVTISDREVIGERAPSRLIGILRAARRCGRTGMQKWL